MKAWWAQTRAEVRMTVRRGETLLLTLGIPILLLVFFSETHVTTTPAGVVSTSSRRGSWPCAFSPRPWSPCPSPLVSSAPTVSYDDSTSTPLGQRRMIAAKIAGVFVTEIIQVVVLGLVAVALHWRPHGGVGGAFEAALALLLGSAGCAGIGLLLAGRLRAEVNLAASNGLYLILLLVSGIVVPLTSLPAVVRHVALYLPSGAMADVLHSVLGHAASVNSSDWWSLGAWALIAPLLAARTFRFD